MCRLLFLLLYFRGLLYRSFWCIGRFRWSLPLPADEVHEMIATLVALRRHQIAYRDRRRRPQWLTFSASVSQPLPNLALKAASRPASSSSTFNSFCELGFHSGAFLMSFALLYTGCGFVVRRVKEDPSERVMSCVKVYGRFGRLRSVACRTWVVGRICDCIDCRSTRRAPNEGIGEVIAGEWDCGGG